MNGNSDYGGTSLSSFLLPRNTRVRETPTRQSLECSRWSRAISPRTFFCRDRRAAGQAFSVLSEGEFLQRPQTLHGASVCRPWQLDQTESVASELASTARAELQQPESRGTHDIIKKREKKRKKKQKKRKKGKREKGKKGKREKEKKKKGKREKGEKGKKGKREKGEREKEKGKKEKGRKRKKGKEKEKERKEMTKYECESVSCRVRSSSAL